MLNQNVSIEFLLPYWLLGTHRYADPEFVKIIRLQQLISEYLVHVQTSLDVENKQLSNQLEECNRKIELMAAEFKKQEEELVTLRKEFKKEKKIIGVYEMLVALPRTVKTASTMKQHVSMFCAQCLSCLDMYILS